MTAADTHLLEALAKVRSQILEMPFAQLIATIGLLAEDATGHTLWDVEDADFAAAVERFSADLSRRA